MELTNERAAGIVPTFARHASYWAGRWGLDADELESEMLVLLVEEAPGREHSGEPLLAQKPAYIAHWAARWAYSRLRKAQRQAWREIDLNEMLPAHLAETDDSTHDFAVDLAQIGAWHEADTSDAAEIVAGAGRLTPALGALRAALEGMSEEAERIAAHLLAAKSVRALEREGVAPRRAALGVRRQLVRALR